MLYVPCGCGCGTYNMTLLYLPNTRSQPPGWLDLILLAGRGYTRTADRACVPKRSIMLRWITWSCQSLLRNFVRVSRMRPLPWLSSFLFSPLRVQVKC